ncbi:MAG: NADH-quinone oxidoreductase subunit J [Deltaproteobacteria bacterium]
MEQVFFWLLAAGLLISAVTVVAVRNPVTNAVCLVSTLVFEAALFITLEATFLAAVQVIVYAGAVMVLFLFVIMLLDVRVEALGKISWLKTVGVGLAFVLALVGLPKLFSAFPFAGEALHWGRAKVPGTAQDLGHLLFSAYGPLFLITGVLLLVATVGVVVLCRRDPET